MNGRMAGFLSALKCLGCRNRAVEVTVLHFYCCCVILPRVFECACGVCVVVEVVVAVVGVLCVLPWYSPNRSPNYPAPGKSYYGFTLLLDFVLLIVERECRVVRAVGRLLFVRDSTQVLG